MTQSIYNHVSAKLGELDRRMIAQVPPGGNWQNIPSGLSKRVDQIRERSKTRGLIHTTYYGRLRWELPSYTISTYFSRPGNGCHIHPDQDRVLSAREAARLQTFPDSIEFAGSHRAVAKQIGNAVPPILGSAVGQSLPGERVIDVFAGAGGLSQGLIQAGKHVLLAVESDAKAAETYRRSHVDVPVLEHELTYGSSMDTVEDAIEGVGGCDILVGGPPCQSFSTAGKRMGDPRSTLVSVFVELARRVRPPVVVIENVLGLRSFQGGLLLKSVFSDLAEAGYNVELWDLRAEQFGVPQRRRRLFVVASRSAALVSPEPLAPPFGREEVWFPSVRDAIGDLPPLPDGGGAIAAEGAGLLEAQSAFQEYARGRMSVQEYFAALRARFGLRPTQGSLNL